MAKKCCCCSSFFSCRACFPGNTPPPVDSHESATNPMDASAHAIPNACTVSHDASSSADCASTSAVPTQDAPASGGPSSSFPTESDIIKKIGEAAEVDKKDGNVNLEGLIQHISELLELRKENESDKERSTDQHLPKSSGFLKLKEVLSEMIEAASSLKDIIPISRNLLKGLGQAHWALAGLLIVSNILERFEAVSVNRNECFDLLDEMYRLAQYVKDLKERPRLRETMDALIQEALEMIVKAAIMCCAQIPSSRLSRIFSTSADKEKMLKFRGDLERQYKHMKTRFDICLYDSIDCRKWRQATPLEREYPNDAVGIEERLKEVVKLLEWESDKKAVAVIVYGFGGVGKSTLADAVFARLDIVGCKYSMVTLFDDITSTPNIVEKQKCILRDLTMGIAEKKVVGTFKSGQQEIRRMLEKEVAFIYVDNLLGDDHPRELLQQLLPKNMHMAKKVRVLITAREKGVRTVCTGCRMETKVYEMKTLPEPQAMNLLKQEMNDGQIDSSQMKQIIKISGGIPKLLTVVAGFIRSEEDKKKAFRILMEDKGHLQGQAVGNIESYVFDYDRLPDRCKEPFLDICKFFKGMDWDSVADIVGESELDMLEKRALVSKDKNKDLTVHDVILMIGNKRAEETRFNFTNANRSQFEDFLQKDIPGIKGLWFDVYENPSDIPAIKLDSMSNSLKILRLGSLKVKGQCDNKFEKLVFLQGEVPHLPFNISQMPPNLKHMELNGDAHFGDFEISPSDLQHLRNLWTLRLMGFAALKKLPIDLGDIIRGLRELSLSCCTSLVKLPISISNLQCLRVLKMDGCSSLSGLPEDIGSLSSLQQLSLSFCIHIEELPESTSKLQSLENLEMDWCKNLKHLPNDFESLHSLQVLCLRGCESLKVLPRNFEKFLKLKPFETSLEDVVSGLSRHFRRFHQEIPSTTKVT